jgi:hypothetical protein
MLGGRYLPTGALPITASVVRIRYGDRPRALVRHRDDEIPAAVPIGDVAGYLARSEHAAPAADVLSVELEVPAPLLRDGVTFVDTPGIGSGLGTNTATTLHYLPEAAAAIYVTSMQRPPTTAECAFLQQVRDQTDAVFVVVNKRDLISPEAAGTALRRARDAATAAGVGPDAVFDLSALQALTGRGDDDHQLLADSGLPELESSVLGLLRDRRANLLLHGVCARARPELTHQQRDLRIAGAVDDTAAVEREFTGRLTGLRERQRDLVRAMTDRIDATMPGLLADRADAWRAELHQMLVRQLDATPSGELSAPNQVGATVLPDWLARRRDDTYQLLLDLLADDIGVALATARQPRGIGAGLVGLPLEDDLPSRVGWTTAELPMPAPRHVSWTPTPPRHRRLGRSDPCEGLSTALVATERAGRHALDEMARDWLRRFAKQIDRDTAVDADGFRRDLHARPDAFELTRADARLAQLAVIDGAATTSVRPDVAPAAVVPATRAPWRCVVCDRMRDTLSARLRQDQFTLATRADRQAEHAEIGGYCPAHSWQYAKIATPLGTSAAYAPLAERVADGLTAMAETDDLDTGSLAGTACPICAELDAVQTTAVQQVARASAATPVCLPHLRRVLAAGPSTPRAERLIRQLATTLRGLSRDQRSYALKREALRRGLITPEESSAHDVVLRVLAGDPALSRLFGSR